MNCLNQSAKDVDDFNTRSFWISAVSQRNVSLWQSDCEIDEEDAALVSLHFHSVMSLGELTSVPLKRVLDFVYGVEVRALHLTNR